MARRERRHSETLDRLLQRWPHAGDYPTYARPDPASAYCRFRCQTLSMPVLELVTIVVDDYDPAIEFFVGVLGFELVDDSPSLTNDGRPKRWVVVRPRGAETGILLARADGDQQGLVVGGEPGCWTRRLLPPSRRLRGELRPDGDRRRRIRNGTTHRGLRAARRVRRHLWKPVGPTWSRLSDAPQAQIIQDRTKTRSSESSPTSTRPQWTRRRCGVRDESSWWRRLT